MWGVGYYFGWVSYTHALASRSRFGIFPYPAIFVGSEKDFYKGLE